jgi:hypothetical protein
MPRKFFEEVTRKLLGFEISIGLNSIVGVMTAADLTRRYLGPPTASEEMIEEIHALTVKMDGKINVLLATQKVDGGKSPPSL